MNSEDKLIQLFRHSIRDIDCEREELNNRAKGFIEELKDEIKQELIQEFKWGLRDLEDKIREEMRCEYKSKFD